MIAIRPSAKTLEAFAAIEADMARVRTTLAAQTTDEAVARASQVMQRISRNANAAVMLLRGEISMAKTRERQDSEQRRKVG